MHQTLDLSQLDYIFQGLFLKCIVVLSQEGLSLQPKVVSAVDFLLKEMAFPPDTIVAFAECNEVSNLNHQNQRL